MKRVIIIFIVLGILGLSAFGGYNYWYNNATPKFTLKTGQVSKGDLLSTISATGTVEPDEVIDVGAQVSGLITKFGTDTKGKPVDYGSVVDEGSVLALIDTAVYESDVAQQTASLEQAKASVASSRANLVQMQAKLDQAASDWGRAQKLGPSDALAQVTYDNYKASYEIAKANLVVAQAAITQAQANQAAAQASLDRANRNLGYCVIKSPVRGTVIDRRVNVGQTVVSSMNAPSLFLLAKDLNKMQVWVAVNEADIGQIYPGQNVTFTVDALPTDTFTGTVNRVRYNAQMTSNVVTYTVEVSTDNSKGKLLPYLTANVQFETARHADVLLVPNAALRYTPSDALIAPESKNATTRPAGGWAGGGVDRASGAGGAGGAGPTTRRSASRGGSGRGTLWVKGADGLVRSISIRTGPTDGINTEVTGKDISEGMEILTGEERIGGSAATAQGPTNPFAPQMGGRGPGGGAGGAGGRGR